MEVNLQNTHSPCVMCEIHNSVGYRPHADRCQRCDYNIAVCLLRNVLGIDKDVGIDWSAEFKAHYIGELWK